MKPLTPQFVDDATGVMTAAAADLGALMADPTDRGRASALASRLGLLRVAALAAGFADFAALVADAEAPLRRSVEGGRTVDRISMQAVGWAVQALNSALSHALSPTPTAAAA